MKFTEDSPRCIHLDFHTSPLIGDVAADFDCSAWVEQLRDAHVNAITVFAKCHHGMSYYPTRLGVVHPGLEKPDLLGEMLEGLRSAGIFAPVYYSVGFDEHSAARHRDWAQMDRKGAQVTTSAFYPENPPPAPWTFLNFIHPDYLAMMEAEIDEIMKIYRPEGMFFDIVFYHPVGCWSDASAQFRAQRNLGDPETKKGFGAFENAARLEFATRASKIIRSSVPEASIFFNTANRLSSRRSETVWNLKDCQSHFEVESLPTGAWGYHHFAKVARSVARWNRLWLGMTGVFQKAWGDFGGLKPQAALTYECFRSQAMGGGVSIGDQMHPRGFREPAKYALIGAVLKEIAEAEPIYASATPLMEIGVVVPATQSVDPEDWQHSLDGALMALSELHYTAGVVTDEDDLSGFRAIILPDQGALTPELEAKLKAYLDSGGVIVASHQGVRREDGTWSDLLPVGEPQNGPGGVSYWRAEEDFADVTGGADRVVYTSGGKILSWGDGQVLARRVQPYFRRTEAHFCSHTQSPPLPESSEEPALVADAHWAIFADPIFQEYRKKGNCLMRDALGWTLARLIGPPEVGESLPKNVEVFVSRQGDDALVTLLSYSPVRKSLDMDLIEDPNILTGLLVSTRRSCSRAVPVLGPDSLQWQDGAIVLGECRGRAILLLPSYFGQGVSPRSAESVSGTTLVRLS